GVFGVDDAASGAAEGQGEIGVFGEGVAGYPADVGQDVPAEGADGAGYGRGGLEDVVHAAVEVEADHVFDVLPASEQSTPVADLGVARDGCDVLEGDRRHQIENRVWLKQGVAVDHDHDFGVAELDPGV